MGKARIGASSILSNGLFPHQVLRDPKAREPGPTVTFSWTKTPLGQWPVCPCGGECGGGEWMGPGPPEGRTLTAFSRCQRKGLSIRVSQAGSQGPKVSPTCPRVSLWGHGSPSKRGGRTPAQKRLSSLFFGSGLSTQLVLVATVPSCVWEVT